MMVITFKFLLTLGAIIWNLEILKINNETPYNPETDYSDCKEVTQLEKIYLGV